MRSSSVDMMYDGLWTELKVARLVSIFTCDLYGRSWNKPKCENSFCVGRLFSDAKLISIVPILRWSRYKFDRMGYGEVVIDVDKRTVFFVRQPTSIVR